MAGVAGAIKLSQWLKEGQRAFARDVRRLLAGEAFPNSFGNYCAKRVPKAASRGGKPLEPRERFNSLQAHYLSHRQTYRNPPGKRDRYRGGKDRDVQHCAEPRPVQLPGAKPFSLPAASSQTTMSGVITLAPNFYSKALS